MKKTILSICTIILLMMTSCGNSEELLLGTLELSIAVEQPVSSTVSTRAVDAELQVEVWSVDGATMLHKFTPGQSPNRMTLEAGSYLLKAFTPNYQTTYGNDELGEAKYYAEKVFSIEPAVVNRISCPVPMINTAVSLSLPEGFNTWFTSYSFSIKQSTTSRTVSIEVGQTAYFDCTDGATSLLYTLTSINTDDEPNSDSNTLSASAGTHYRITYAWETKCLLAKKEE